MPVDVIPTAVLGVLLSLAIIGIVFLLTRGRCRDRSGDDSDSETSSVASFKHLQSRARDLELGDISNGLIEDWPPRANTQTIPTGNPESTNRDTFDDFGLDARQLKFEKVIGIGTNGKVYKALYRGMDVAVKEIIVTQSGSDVAQQDFTSELRALRRLANPHVIELYGATLVHAADTLGSTRFLLVTELAMCSLKDLLRSDESLSLAQCLRLGTEIAKGCAYIHAMRVVHFDIKPANVLLTESGRVKICDLGLSRVGSKLNSQFKGESKNGVHGTPAYMAPEILRGQESVLSYGVDVYSWTLVMWEMLHRRRPHPSTWTLALLFTEVLGGYRPSIGPLVPARIRRLMERGWSGDPENRPEFEKIMVELSWAERELRRPERAFLPAQAVTVWSRYRFIPGHIARNVGDGTYEVRLAGFRYNVKSFPASDILLVDGDAEMFDWETRPAVSLEARNFESTPLAMEPNSFSIHVVDDEVELDNSVDGNTGETMEMADERRRDTIKRSSGDGNRSIGDLMSRQWPAISKTKSSVTRPQVTLQGLSSRTTCSLPAARPSVGSEWSGLDGGIFDIDDSKTAGDVSVQIDGIRIGVNGIMGESSGTSGSAASGELGLNRNDTIAFCDGIVQLNEIGRGATGRVHRGLLLNTFELVAIKSIRINEESSRYQIAKEIRAFDARVRQPENQRDALIQMYGAYYDPNDVSVKIVMQYMDGGSCDSMMMNLDSLSELTMAAIAIGALRSLNELHTNFRMHRDIKPANILVDRRHGAKLSDLGLARDMMAEGGKHHENDAMAETFVGTISYMSIERLEGKAYSYPADIWALGVTLTALARGSNPFQSMSFFQLLEFLQKNPFPSIPSRFSDTMCDFLALCTHRDPESRASAKELLEHPWLQPYTSGGQSDLPHASLVELIDKLSEGVRYKRDELNDIAARTMAHLTAELSEQDKQAGAKVLVPMSKLRRLSDQMGVPVKHTIRAFKMSVVRSQERP